MNSCVREGENAQVQQQLGDPRDKGILHFWDAGRLGKMWLFLDFIVPELNTATAELLFGWL